VRVAKDRSVAKILLRVRMLLRGAIEALVRAMKK
jgi:hypothetical protein